MKKLSIAFAAALLASSLAAQTRVVLNPERIVTTFTRSAVSGSGNTPAFAAAGRDGHFLIAWSEFDDMTYTRASLRTAAIDSTGAIIEGSRYTAPAVRLSDPNAHFPAVAFDGERFLVAWIEGRTTLFVTRLVAMRFDRDGKPLDAVPQEVSLVARQTYIAVAAGGGEFTIAYSSNLFNSPLVTRMASDGTILDRDRVTSGTPGFWRDIESNGTAALLVSDVTAPAPLRCNPICGTVTARSFTRLVPSTSRVDLVGPSTQGFGSPVGTGLATDGTRFLAATWAPNLTIAQTGSLIRGQLTDPAGSQFVREFVIAKHPEAADRNAPGGRIDAVWNGSSYAIAYEVLSMTDVDLRLVFVSQIGMAVTDPVELAVTAQQERTPVVLPLGEGRVLVLYERGSYARPEIVARQATLSLRTRAVR